MLIDTHAHLNFPSMRDDIPHVLARAAEHSVMRVITIGTSLLGSREGIAHAAEYPNVRATVGIHPTSESLEAAYADLSNTKAELQRLALMPGVVAIGETGLDFFRIAKDSESGEQQKTIQREMFRAQLQVAALCGLPVVVHQRAAWDDTLAILDEMGQGMKAVFHCFGGSEADASALAERGYLVSFTGIVTFKNGADVLNVAARLPVKGFMLETDAPYLAPVPFRGAPCEPMHTYWTAKAISSARGESLETLSRETSETAADFFGWGLGEM